MIVRILGEGQFELDDGRLDALNQLDEALVAAVERGDESGYASALGDLLAAVRSEARAVADDFIGPSDALLPSEDVSLGELRDLLGDEGLIPG